MKKSQLKTGHLLELENGEFVTVIKSSLFSGGIVKDIESGSWDYLDIYNNDMINESEHGHASIIKVYKPAHPGFLGVKPSSDGIRRHTLIWERPEEIIELTIDEIAEWKGVDPSKIKIKK